MNIWKITTNFIHDPIDIRDTKNNIVSKIPCDANEREMKMIRDLINKHNLEVKEDNNGTK